MELKSLGGDPRPDPAQARPALETGRALIPTLLPEDRWSPSGPSAVPCPQPPPRTAAVVPGDPAVAGEIGAAPQAPLRSAPPPMPASATPPDAASAAPVVLHAKEPATATLTPSAEGPSLLQRLGTQAFGVLHSVQHSVQSVFSRNDDTAPLRPTLDAINALAPRFQAMSDAQLEGMTADFKSRLAAGETLDNILPEAYATVREASSRVLKMRPFDVQVLGGIAMHQGKIAEMKTGEGKTLAATMPVYLHALTGEGSHVVTVNETLAKRDAESMGKLYNFLGLSVGVALEGQTPEQKRAAYNCDVTYTTNTTLGFDFLRDNMARRPEDVVCRDPNFALVDEVDEILIDEARTPLIISQLQEPSARDYETMAHVVSQLVPGDDFKVNVKDHETWLTEAGEAKAEKMLGVDNLYDEQHQDKVHYLQASLVARNLFTRDKDYVVHDGKVDIVDEFTGRIMDGRRYNDGIHQALEAKEGVPVQPEQRTMASITYPNLFRRYQALAGMSGTARTEAAEFSDLYGLGVAVIPSNRPSQRVDQPDLVYKTYQEKFKAIGDYVQNCYQNGEPVLIGTRNIIVNEYLHQMLNARGIPHQLLNAKSVQDNTEAENAIVAQAGKSGMVTLATNMAGRGVDIKPDLVNFKKLTVESVRNLNEGRRVLITLPKAEAAQDVRLWMGANQVGVANAVPTLSDVLAGKAGPLFAATAPAAPGGSTAAPRVQVVVDDRPEAERAAGLPDLGVGGAVSTINGCSPQYVTGGLHIVGTERHESRRIDNQLVGRSGRQGSPGTTQFFVSLDDELMRLFGGDRLKTAFDRLGVRSGQAVQDPMVDKAIATAQEKVEEMHFDQRRNTTKYDKVLNVQREVYYADRKGVLDGADLRPLAAEWVKDGIDHILEDAHAGKRVTGQQARTLWTQVAQSYGLSEGAPPPSLSADKVDCTKFRDEIVDLIRQRLAAKEALGGASAWQTFLREVTLDDLDQAWAQHLEDMEDLQNGIGWVSYVEQDPWVVYQQRAFDSWKEMQQDVEARVVREALGAQVAGEKASTPV